MLNDTCVYGCKYFDEHFKAIYAENTAGRPYSADIEECWLPKFNPDIESKYNCMDIDAEHIHKLKMAGVHSFKITGRELESQVLWREIKTFVGRVNGSNQDH